MSLKQKASAGGIYITKKWKTETLQPGLEFDDLNPDLKAVCSNSRPD